MKAARFKVKTQHGCLCISEGNQLSSEMCHWHFHFILPIMPDKTAFKSVDRAAFIFAVQLFSSGLQSAERKSFVYVRDFRVRIIWFSSGLQSAERKSFD